MAPLNEKDNILFPEDTSETIVPLSSITWISVGNLIKPNDWLVYGGVLSFLYK